MSNPLLCQRLNRLKDDVMRFKNAVCAYETTDAAKYPENFESLGLEVTMKAEAIACSTRNIVSIFPAGGRKRILQAVADTQGIKVSKWKDGYEIIMPGLMTKRDSRNNVEFILEPLSYALDQFTHEHPAERLEQALIWFIYEYGEDTPARHIRDFDNLEAKEVLDVINAFFLIDDGGDFCQLHYSTSRGESDRTRIIISPDMGFIPCPK